MEKIADLNGVKLLERNIIKNSNKFYDIRKDENKSILFIKMNEGGLKIIVIMQKKLWNQNRIINQENILKKYYFIILN